MQVLKDRILSSGTAPSPKILKVDTFLNHQMDPQLMSDIGEEFSEYFKDRGVTKILTLEASGIAMACMTGYHMHVNVIFAKKHEALNLDNDIYTSKVFSHTKNKEYIIKVATKLLDSQDRVLIIDDFLANGVAALGLVDIVEQAGATVVGVGMVIEKAFQKGGRLLREKGYDLFSLAIVQSLEDGKITLE